MKYIRNNSKGFTLVELLVSLGIFGLVLSAIFSFLLFNYKIFYKADEQIEVQYQAQIAMNELIDNIIDAEGIAQDENGYGIIEPIINNDLYNDVNRIVFKINDNKYIEFNFNDNKLYRGENSLPTGITTNQYALNIKEFKIRLIGSDSYENQDYSSCRGIGVKIVSEVNETEFELENQVYFRNWQK